MSSEPAVAFPTEGRLLGVDFGTRRIGLAVSTPDGRISSPLEIYERRNESLDRRYFLEIIDEYRIVGLVVGLPIHLSGGEGASARLAREYGTWLSRVTGLPVRYWDERYTSVIAEEHMLGADLSRKKRKKRLDMIAAQIMLQSYLDRPQGESKPL